MRTKIYDRIAYIAEAKHMTIKEVEMAARLPFGTIEGWKTRKPYLGEVFKVQEALGLEISDLV